MCVPFIIREGRSIEKNRTKWLHTKAGIVWDMGPFQKPSKPAFHKAWQEYSIEPGWQPRLALIYYCQTVCCLYLPRLTNWTFVGLAAPPENWNYYYLHCEFFHGMCPKIDLSWSWFLFPVQVAHFLSGMTLILFYHVFVFIFVYEFFE